MKIGIFGGSFNPVHNGHIEAAREAIKVLGLEKLYFMPANKNGMKLRDDYLSAEIRKRLLEAALKDMDDQRIKLSTMELDRGGISYTYDTYKELMKIYPEDSFSFIYGSDCLYTIEKWHQSKFLLEHLELCFISRAGGNLTEEGQKLKCLSEKYGGNMKLLECSLPDISSTIIRDLCKHNQDISGLVPSSVAALIHDERLYCNE